MEVLVAVAGLILLFVALGIIFPAHDAHAQEDSTAEIIEKLKNAPDDAFEPTPVIATSNKEFTIPVQTSSEWQHLNNTPQALKNDIEIYQDKGKQDVIYNISIAVGPEWGILYSGDSCIIALTITLNGLFQGDGRAQMVLYDTKTKEKSKPIPMVYNIQDELCQVLRGDSFGGHTFFEFIQNHNSVICRIEFEGVANGHIIDFKLPEVETIKRHLEDMASLHEKFMK